LLFHHPFKPSISSFEPPRLTKYGVRHTASLLPSFIPERDSGTQAARKLRLGSLGAQIQILQPTVMMMMMMLMLMLMLMMTTRQRLQYLFSSRRDGWLLLFLPGPVRQS